MILTDYLLQKLNKPGLWFVCSEHPAFELKQYVFGIAVELGVPVVVYSDIPQKEIQNSVIDLIKAKYIGNAENESERDWLEQEMMEYNTHGFFCYPEELNDYVPNGSFWTDYVFFDEFKILSFTNSFSHLYLIDNLSELSHDYGSDYSRALTSIEQEAAELRARKEQEAADLRARNTQGEIEYHENSRVKFLKNRIKSIDGYSAKYIKKYGKTAGNALYKGRFVGLSFAAVNEFVKDLNSMADEGVKYVLKAYEPTTSDVIRYGRGVKRYTLFSVGLWAINLTEIKVLNGKVIVQRDVYYGGMEQLKHSDLETLDLY